MKPIIFNVLMLLSLSAGAQGTWPLNPATSKVAFSGVKLWPAAVKSEQQRIAFARTWYFSFLTDVKEKETARWLKMTEHHVTYGAVPTATYWERKISDDNVHKLSFHTTLKATSSGLVFTFTDFELIDIGEDFMTKITMEKALKDKEFQQCATCMQDLKVFRAKLHAALGK
jgi:hypothetical protein